MWATLAPFTPFRVRKHRAPNGALRRVSLIDWVGAVMPGQKAPSAKRCIKTGATDPRSGLCFHGQKAPSAKRCIKTFVLDGFDHGIHRHVRKHRAPNGALRRRSDDSRGSIGGGRQKAPSAKRCIKTPSPDGRERRVYKVRKHRAPNGALRLNDRTTGDCMVVGQKAPSAKRCIKTHQC